ncbi:DUF4041 domain-containing protein [Echinimonas agarilytica]|uniref:DUF4041 domain-containing protein n=1 Tax=Echinimonas agarilytica TaxID=1215918 RepID=A0AA42B8K2_9GAMM|nr:DUF4041 domain-containing protein [Echinimonas agarilytica]MCM2681115.1 DUF4041 domain-containing protein [Echinimonas agarilytica]
MEFSLETLLTLSIVVFFILSVYLIRSRSHLKKTQELLEKKQVELDETDKALKKIQDKYSAIIDIETEVENSKKEKETIHLDVKALRDSYKEKRALFDKLVQEAAIYDEEIQLAELGFYKPHFDFDTSEKYKEEIAKVKAAQKEMVASKEAIYCNTEWTVEGSKAKGRTMTNRGIKLTARAFNNECDAAISNARWNNVDRLVQRLEKAFDAINKMNQSNAIVISNVYFNLKLKELRLAYEYADKKQQEKEEQQEIKRQMREEAKLQQELDKAEKDEEKFKKMLEKAQREAEKSAGSKLDELNEKIASLSQELEEAHEKSERAKSMAQQTKIGHVYVISNIGSFGENVYKIGMTRRLEPLDRVKELGDASVPFIFDVHAMIHSDDAPALENALHKKFDLKRLNLVNSRKEFFRVNLTEIEEEVLNISPDAEFIETAEARDYRESQSILAQQKELKSKQDSVNELPLEI